MQPFKDSEVPVSRSSSEVDLLRSLLVSPEMEAVGDLREVLEALQEQIKDPEQLTGLLLPVIADVLARKVSESGAAVAKAIAPIIDKAIHERTLQDRASIAAAIGPIITEALKNEIRISPADMAAALAPVATRAIAQRHAASPQEVAHDLAPIIGGAIKEQIRSERDAIVDALYPVIGSTIAKYMSETLNNLIQTINVKIERSLSMQGLFRKVRARLKGVTETELLLKESMPCRVDAVFLIHKASGLLIAQSQHPNAMLVDSDLLSGMLTAIRSLFNESLAQSGKVSELDQIEYGQSKIVLEVAGYCYLAAVVDGEPGQNIIDAMRKTLAEIVQGSDAAIQHYGGDSSTVPRVVHDKLRDLLAQSPGAKSQPRSKPYPFFVAAGLLLLLILIPLGIGMYRDSQDRDLQNRAAAAIANALPGEQIHVAVERERLELTGVVVNQYVRTQAEFLAKGFAPTSSIQNALTLAEQPPLSILTVSQVRQVSSVLNGIDGVSLASEFHDGVLSLSGTVEAAPLVNQVQKAFERLPGIQSIINKIDVKQPAIENRIYFDVGSSALKATERTKVTLLKQWLDRHSPIKLRIIGHNDQTGPDAVNRRLAQNRAITVRDILIKSGINPNRLAADGGSSMVPGIRSEEDTWVRRCVRFEVIMEPGVARK